MRNFKGCASCLHEDEDGEGPNCGPCLQAWSEDRLEPNWAPKEAAGCGGTMCHTPTCSDCFPKDIWGLNPTTVIHDDVEPLPENPKAIYGRAKPSLALFPAGALIPSVEVFQLGADKYGPFNWRKDPVEAMTYANAALRHIFAWIDGNDQDLESGQSELAHALCCMAIVLDAAANGKLIDNRPNKGTCADLLRARTKPIDNTGASK